MDRSRSGTPSDRLFVIGRRDRRTERNPDGTAGPAVRPPRRLRPCRAVPAAPADDQRPAPQTSQLPDEQAVARYRYLLRTAPPEQIEQAHAEAFAQLTPDQRQQVLAQLAAAVPAGERPRTDDPETLARAATRAETAPARHPGAGLGATAPVRPGYGRGYGGG